MTPFPTVRSARVRTQGPVLIFATITALAIAMSARAFAGQGKNSQEAAVITEGVNLLRAGQAERAKTSFDEAVRAFPRSAEALTWRGISENELQQYEAAESDFTAAIKLVPSMPAAHYNLALSLIRLKKIDAAIKQLRIMVTAQPDSVQVRYNLAVLLEGKGLWEEAAKELGAAHRIDSADKGVTLHLLEDELKVAQFETIGALISDLADASTPPETQREAAIVLIGIERYSEAIVLLESAHSRAPEDQSTGLLLARILLVEDRADDAMELLAKLSAEGEGGAQISALTGVALAATHRIDEAIAVLKKAVEQDRSLSLAHNVLGFCFFQRGRYAEAGEAYGHASRLEPQRRLYARDASLAYERANQPAEALAFAERANALGRPDASDHLMLGKLYASANSNQDAVRELLHAVELNPDLDSAVYLLARTYMKMGEPQQAAVWSGRFTALKQKHEADSVKAAPPSVRSSILLTGGSMTSDDAGEP